jgi:hypothetical protein
MPVIVTREVRFDNRVRGWVSSCLLSWGEGLGTVLVVGELLSVARCLLSAKDIYQEGHRGTRGKTQSKSPP